MKKVICLLTALTILATFCVAGRAKLYGDVNSDGTVNSIDALLVLNKSVGNNVKIDEKAADLDKNGVIDSFDALGILLIDVGKYNGELEFEDELVTDYKAKVIDPVMSTGKYTICTVMKTDDGDCTAVMEFNGNNVAVTTEIKGVQMRTLFLDGKTYIVFPKLHAYSEYSGEGISAGDDVNYSYVKSEYAEIDGKQTVCEYYVDSDGNTAKYYFLDGEWIGMQKGDGEYKVVTDFYKGVNASSFSLDGMLKVNINK